MSIDQFGGFRGSFFGADRTQRTTPSPDASDTLQPYLPVAYPAPWLPIRRRNPSHPVEAGVVLSEGYLVGVDKSGALIPAGLFSGAQPKGAVKAVASYAIATDVITFNVPNGYAVGDNVVIAGAAGANAFVNGQYTVVSAAADHFTAAITHADANTTAIAGATAQATDGGDYCIVAYTQFDVGSTINAATGARVAVAGEYVVLAAPADAAAGDKVTLPNGTQITITADDVTFAHSCNLIPGGRSKGLGFAIRDVWQYIGGIEVQATDGGVEYIHLAQRPDLSQVTNYLHEMGTAIKTHYVLRLPWIGATPSTLQELANADGVQGYVQTDFGRSFVHLTGQKGDSAGDLFLGCSIVPSRKGHGTDAGNYAPYNPETDGIDDLVGRVLGVEKMYPIRDFADRVRTQFERASEFVGPRMDPHATTFEMAGSATKGMDFAINLTTDGIFKKATAQGKTQHGEYSTYVYVHVSC